MHKNSNSSQAFPRPVEDLILTVQKLSLTRNIDDIVEIVRHEARRLTGADGATFVLRDNGKCYYVDEDAIAPLWKGKKFPMETCISGWTMLNRQAAVIEDIYQDDRIPIDAYRPTFVKSLLMVPIRTQSPIGAIGNYWAQHHKPTDDEIRILQALADSTSVAIENAQLYSSLQVQIDEYKTLSQKLQTSLEEKEVLLKEVYHRVKNNLQIVSSLLNLHSESISDENTRLILAESITRILTMSIVHEMLYQTEDKTRINLSDYIGKLIENIYKISDISPDKVMLASNISPITLSIDQAIPCGLIINELISNVYKHSKPASGPVKFSISISENGGQVIINAMDNNADAVKVNSNDKGKLGLNLVKQLASQLSGKAMISVNGGTIVEVTFPHHPD